MGIVRFSSRDLSAGTTSSNPSSSIPLNTSYLLLRFSLPLSLLALIAALGSHRGEELVPAPKRKNYIDKTEAENEEEKPKRKDENGRRENEEEKPKQKQRMKRKN
ncbi:hypothetical protein OIU74_022975 [Salix koriyanagi]|uniref:Uncharacterized protein n=1 Tax=Salix koriyanagi TaxID=2511006 RepID=A0A9Q1AFK4_9ROSI|nr:hypothetical protein OIU74_022975 [Salix koriyanagi]